MAMELLIHRPFSVWDERKIRRGTLQSSGEKAAVGYFKAITWRYSFRMMEELNNGNTQSRRSTGPPFKILTGSLLLLFPIHEVWKWTLGPKQDIQHVFIIFLSHSI